MKLNSDNLLLHFLKVLACRNLIRILFSDISPNCMPWIAKVSLFFQFFRFGKIANVRIHIGNEASEQNERVWENEIAGFIEILPFIANLEIHIRNGCFVLLLSDQNQRDQENAYADFTENLTIHW